ncbi:unnamed protein product, partial [Darwinula stevensoni]
MLLHGISLDIPAEASRSASRASFGHPTGLLPLHPPESKRLLRKVLCPLFSSRRGIKSIVLPKRRLKTNETRRLKRSPFDPRSPVALLAHGFLEHGRKPWLLVLHLCVILRRMLHLRVVTGDDEMQRMTEELLKSRDQNVVVLSWLGGSGPPYTQAVANIRLVGVMAAHFLAFLAVRNFLL